MPGAFELPTGVCSAESVCPLPVALVPRFAGPFPHCVRDSKRLRVQSSLDSAKRMARRKRPAVATMVTAVAGR
jgi:hypothetical protein